MQFFCYVIVQSEAEVFEVSKKLGFYTVTVKELGRNEPGDPHLEMINGVVHKRSEGQALSSI